MEFNHHKTCCSKTGLTYTWQTSFDNFKVQEFYLIPSIFTTQWLYTEAGCQGKEKSRIKHTLGPEVEQGSQPALTEHEESGSLGTLQCK